MIMIMSISRQICVPVGFQQTIVTQCFFAIFELGRMTKRWMIGPVGNSEFFFIDINVPSGEAERNIEGLGETNSLHEH